jgi:hypothetical protein
MIYFSGPSMQNCRDVDLQDWQARSRQGAYDWTGHL